MDFHSIPLIWLRDGDDVREARAMEAGLYAAHLITLNGPDPRLEAVVAAGAEATERLWWVGIRIARAISSRVASINHLPYEDLFQEGCVAVAQAIRSFDHARGVRYSTFVHHIVGQALSDAEHHRVGYAVPSRLDRRAARLTRQAWRDNPRVNLAEACSAAGVTVEAALRGYTRHTSLDEDATSDPHAQDAFDRASGPSLDFLELLADRHRRMLEARYRGDGETLVEVAARFGVSTSTAGRWEQEALAAARRLLSADRTTLSRVRR